jgi:hypothetical protein
MTDKQIAKIRKKAKSVASNHFRGGGKTERVFKLILEAIGKPCPYCKEEITIENISLDHAIPLIRSRLPKSKQVLQGKAEPYTPEELKALTHDDNKLFCCSTCNAAKGDFDDIEFDLLIKCLTKWEQACIIQHELYEKIYQLSPKKGKKKEVLSRMKSGGFRFSRGGGK